MARARLFRLLFIPCALLVVFVLTPLFTIATLEEHDPFCGACHTVPEEVYLARAHAAAQPGGAQPDLASAHYARAEPGRPLRCIACHRGDDGPEHRLRTLARGAGDTLIWLRGQANPVIEKGTAADPALIDAACVRCHAQALLTVGFNNHFHNKLPAAYALWQSGAALVTPAEPAAGPAPGALADAPDACSGASATVLRRCATSVTCTSCHQGHLGDGDAGFFYLKRDGVVQPACRRCHVEVGHGPQR